jgi:hypothetical protein
MAIKYMKKWWLYVYIGLSFSLLISGVSGQTVVKVLPLTQNVQLNDQFPATIWVEGATDLMGIEFDLQYDDSMLDVVSVVKETAFLEGSPASTVSDSNDLSDSGWDTPGLIDSFIILRSDAIRGVDGSGSVATITFNAHGPIFEGNGALILTEVKLANSQSTGIIHTTEDGELNFLVGCVLDSDGDGSFIDGPSCGLIDCDDNDPNEKPNQIWYLDADGDGHGDANTPTQISCERPLNRFVASELITTDQDCRDDIPTINPDAVEVCDGVDNNCAGGQDEGKDALCPNDGPSCTTDICDSTGAESVCGIIGCCRVADNSLCSDGDLCNGEEICNIDSGCDSTINVPDCSIFDKDLVDTCQASDDGIDTTYDFRAPFPSECDDSSGEVSCSLPPPIAHTCDAVECSQFAPVDSVYCVNSLGCSGFATCGTDCLCGDIECSTHEDCGAGFYCDSAQHCISDLANGMACDSVSVPVFGAESQGGVCLSGACNTDYNTGGKYCSSATDICVYFDGFTVQEFSNQAKALDCLSVNQERKCINGVWGNGATCTDTLMCSDGEEICSSGVCAAGLPIDCEDGIICTTHSCSEANGCVQDNSACGCNLVDVAPRPPEGPIGDGVVDILDLIAVIKEKRNTINPDLSTYDLSGPVTEGVKDGKIDIFDLIYIAIRTVPCS